MNPLLNDPRHPRTAILAAHCLLALCLAVAALMFSLSPGGASAQSGGGFDLSWNSIDAGGQRSSGGAFSLDGVIGQPDAGPPGAGVLTGGPYTLQGGFLTFFIPPQTANRNWYLYE